MQPRAALKAVLVIALGGLTFSGYLSYGELFGTCTVGCSAVEASGGIFGLPACVYGFFMYLAVTIVASLGLKRP